ncbi:amino acid kinase family protein [Methanoplanus endosymbiosus]|uniref:Uridylate kinase n=1 Tax=Methanoplanus endosymbiosus TaxID=33865 RepID=A0A9E7PKL1_9EURY|nr:uridylate kinase [Methanoplanus endosymbiosus]UUX91600.1 uridylate kinase [Methanoplanus endosymbiosus]
MSKRKEIKNKLQGETLVRKGLMHERSGVETIRITPELNVIKVGGHGTIDFGKEVVIPIVEELGELSREHQMLIVTGGGVRVRHIMDIGIDLGMPTGILAELSGTISEQNALMLSVLMAKYNAVKISNDDLLDIPMLLSLGQVPIMRGTPIYSFYETPTVVGPIPSHRTDTGAFLAAEVMGAKNCILVKNVDGLFDKNPLLYDDAELIEDIRAEEVLEMDLEDLVLEEAVLEMLQHSKNMHEVKIVNGHVRGNITKVLNGEKVGTIIRQ